ncbi:MAG: hypothetical protein L0958_05775, partial [Candidatus Mariimomonas ferrooxydans]
MKEILIFDPDDDAKELKSITASLKKKNFSVLSFKTIKEAGIRVEKSRPCVILIRLPQGLEARYLSRFRHVAPVIGIIEKEDDKIIRKAFKLGIEEFITFPHNPFELRLKVESCLQRHQHVEALENERKHLLAIIDITSLTSSTLDPHEILFLVVKKIAEVIPVLRCSMIRVDNEHRYAHVVATFENPRLKSITLALHTTSTITH